MNCNRPGNEFVQRMNPKCDGEKDGNSSFVDMAIHDSVSNVMHVTEKNNGMNLSSASYNDVTPSVDLQTTTVADAHSKHQSLYFSQEASSIFDKALEMHAAPTNDPPMWGDDLDDFREAADMLEDIGDLSSPDNDYSALNISAARSKKGSFGCFSDDEGTSIAHDFPHVNFNDSESKSNKDVGSTVNVSNSAALNADFEVPVQLMNMDKRIFEDSMFLGTISPFETGGTVFDSRGVHNDSVANMFNTTHGLPDPDHVNYFAETLQESTVAANALPFQQQTSVDAQTPKSHPQLSMADLQIVTPKTINSARAIHSMQGTPKQASTWFAPLPGLDALPLQDSTPDFQLNQKSNINCNIRNNEESVAMTKIQVQKQQQDDPSKVTNKSDAAWKRRFLELEEFKRVNGHCNVPQKYEKNTSLGAWLARQRLLMRQWEDQREGEKHGRDTSLGERVECLKNLGLDSSIGKGAFGKICSRNANEWEKRYADLLKYRDTHGTCNVPTKCTTLGRWVSSQRKKYRQFLADGDKDQDEAIGWSKELSSRFQRLRDIGFNFHLGKGNAQINRKCPAPSNLTKSISL